jgi:hypothetical protein
MILDKRDNMDTNYNSITKNEKRTITPLPSLPHHPPPPNRGKKGKQAMHHV